MIKKIAGLFTALAVLVSACVILYWRDTAYNPSGMDLIRYFLLLPLVITAILLSPYFMHKGLQQRKQQQEERQRKAAETAAQREAAAQESLKPKPAECTQFELNIYSAAAWHSFGENEAILEKSRQFKSPELDPDLCNAYGLPVLSFRIQALDELAQLDEDDDAEAARNTMREKRIQQLLQQQIEQHAETLWHVSSHLQRSALYYDSDLARQYRMHPAWTDPDYAGGEPEHSVP